MPATKAIRTCNPPTAKSLAVNLQGGEKESNGWHCERPLRDSGQAPEQAISFFGEMGSCFVVRSPLREGSLAMTSHAFFNTLLEDGTADIHHNSSMIPLSFGPMISYPLPFKCKPSGMIVSLTTPCSFIRSVPISL